MPISHAGSTHVAAGVSVFEVDGPAYPSNDLARTDTVYAVPLVKLLIVIVFFNLDPETSRVAP